MIIIVNGGIATGKSTLWQHAARSLGPSLGRVAAFDLEELFRMTNPDLDSRDPGWLHDWLLARRHAAMLSDSFLANGFETVLVTGPFFTRDEIAGYVAWLRSEQPVYHVTLRVSPAEMKRRVMLRGDADKSEAWIEDYYPRLQAVYQPWMEVVNVDGLAPEAILQHIGAMVLRGAGHLPDPLP